MNSLNSDASILPRKMSAAFRRKPSSCERVILSWAIVLPACEEIRASVRLVQACSFSLAHAFDNSGDITQKGVTFRRRNYIRYRGGSIKDALSYDRCANIARSATGLIECNLPLSH